MKTFRLINAQVAENCFKAIEQAVADTQNTPHKVMVTIDDDKARSNAQNRLYWKWLHELEQQTGQDDEYWHCYFKRRFLARIYARDDGDFAQMAQSINDCKKFMDNYQYENLVNGVIKQISTTKASVKQMSEYLNKIERWVVENGLGLIVPSELAWVIKK